MPLLKSLLAFVFVPMLLVGLLSACAPVRTLNLLADVGTGHRVTEDVAYGTLARQKLDIYTPTGRPPPVAGWPMVVFFYGGSWSAGNRADYKFVGSALAEHGVLAIVADYRLFPEVRYPSFLEDSAQALAWALAEASRLGADPKRVFAMGHSAGGYNAAMLALDSRWLSATGHHRTELAGWIGLAGPYDFLPSDLPDVRQIFMHPNYPPKAQPIDVDLEPQISTPVFLGAPVHDKVVSPTRSTRALAEKLSAAGVPVTLKMYERPNHATLIGAFSPPLRWIAPVFDDVLSFIEITPPAR